MLTDFITEYSIEGVDHKIDIEKALQKLDQMERVILSLSLLGFTHQEIGDRVGYTRSNISKIVKKIHKKASLGK